MRVEWDLKLVGGSLSLPAGLAKNRIIYFQKKQTLISASTEGTPVLMWLVSVAAY